MTVEDFERYLERAEAYLDSFIEAGTEQELFAASYIHGHFSVVAAKLIKSVFDFCEDEKALANQTRLGNLIQQFESDLKNSIEIAIESNELSTADAEDVLLMLDTLFNQR